MMLVELRVRDLGIIEDTTVLFGPGLTAITGETGAGKTLLVGAISLLLGARADGGLVRRGAAEARVEGRFVADDDEEVVVTRVLAAEGRSRAYVDGGLATVAELAARTTTLVDLHGQHAHVRLLEPGAWRALLDDYAGAAASDARRRYREARGAHREIDQRLAALGGDTRARARELDLLRFQLDEIAAAAIADLDEDAHLAAEEELLEHATAYREALGLAHDRLEGPALDAIGTARAALSDRRPFAEQEARLRSVEADVADLVHELRVARDDVALDPARLDDVRTRRRRLRELCRKYGDTLADVSSYARESASRLAELESHDVLAAELEARAAECDERVDAAASELHAVRAKAAPALAAAVTDRLADLALARAVVEIGVRRAAALEDGADEVDLRFGANPGEPARPLDRVASGGELSRVMLALRVVAGGRGAAASVFDEIDAGIGGEAGLAVGRTLAELARGRQVLCVTHLPQVAAFADAQVVVAKRTAKRRTVATAELLLDDARVDELARMLAGVASDNARHHARELLALRDTPRAGGRRATGRAAR